jgi:ABC-2 type transport system ATP-binding protein
VVEDVAVSCERVVVLNKGTIVYDGNPEHLAQYADGKVWELKGYQEQIRHTEENYRIITQIPEQDGVIRLRVLSATQPHADAYVVEPNLEDGYLQLIHGNEKRVIHRADQHQTDTAGRADREGSDHETGAPR